MTTKSSGPVGWVISKQPESMEARELVSVFLIKNKPIIDPLVNAIGQAAAAGDFDSLMLWRTTLRGLAEDVERILTRDMVAVQPDQDQVAQN